MQCPKCGFEQEEGGAECARCGVIFARLAELAEGEEGLYRPAPKPPAEPAFRWQELLFEEAGELTPAKFWGRAALFAVLVVWGGRLAFSSLASNRVGESFLHLVNLPFHEAGHVIFGFLGDFLHTLGGTLGQLLIPAICLGTLLLRQRDPFGASVALWWLGENFLDIGPYVADARAGRLMLLGGVTGRDAPGYHDWENLLGRLHLLDWDERLGALSYNFGRLVMLAALLWAAELLSRQWRELRRSQAGD
ncbi:MAG: zinc ribbon domain-containing protein [Thermoanaerobaculia bacterium]